MDMLLLNKQSSRSKLTSRLTPTAPPLTLPYALQRIYLTRLPFSVTPGSSARLVPGCEWASLLKAGREFSLYMASGQLSGGSRSLLPKNITSSICPSSRRSSSSSLLPAGSYQSASRAARPASARHPSSASTPRSVAAWYQLPGVTLWSLVASSSWAHRRGVTRRWQHVDGDEDASWADVRFLPVTTDTGTRGPVTGYPARAPTGQRNLLLRMTSGG
jgi:hypothetical protein